MPTVTLDANTVRTAICPADKKKLDLFDAGIPGFVLEVRPSGGKTYYLRYRDAHGKQKQLRIGDATGISFEQAKAAVSPPAPRSSSAMIPSRKSGRCAPSQPWRTSPTSATYPTSRARNVAGTRTNPSCATTSCPVGAGCIWTR